MFGRVRKGFGFRQALLSAVGEFFEVHEKVDKEVSAASVKDFRSLSEDVLFGFSTCIIYVLIQERKRIFRQKKNPAEAGFRISRTSNGYRTMNELILRYEVHAPLVHSAERETKALLEGFAILYRRSLESFSPPKPYPEPGQ